MQSASLVLVKVLTGFFAALPFRLLYIFSDGLYFWLFHIIRYRRKVVRQNLRNSFPDRDEKEILEISRQFYHHLCDILLESIKGPTLSKEALEKRYSYINAEILNPGFDKGQSIMLFASHYGNWEWGSLSLPLAVRHTVAGIYKPLSNRKVNDYLNHLRQQKGIHLVSMSGTARAISRFRGQPTIFVLIADQTPSNSRSAHWIDFLNQDTPFLPGAAKLAKRTGYPAFVATVKRVRRGFYEVTFEPLAEDPEDLSAEQITGRYAKHLEATIRQYPADWLWSHRRWKRKRANIERVS